MKTKTRQLFFFFFLLQLGFSLTALPYDAYDDVVPYLLTTSLMGITLVISYIQYFRIEMRLSHTAALDIKLSVLKQQQALLTQQKAAVNAQLQEMVKLQQTTTEQLEYFLSLLHQDKPKEALLYLKGFTENHQKSNKPVCDNYLISALLNSKRHRARAHGIEVSYHIQLPMECSISMPDLSCIFFNLMDNGIEACTRYNGKRFISLTAAPNAGFLSIHMKNSKSPMEAFKHESVKTDTLKHGLGLSIIEELVNAYDGSYEWIDEGDTFCSLLLLCSNPTTKETPEE